jgi:ATP-dependent DNA helicase RecQ
MQDYCEHEGCRRQYLIQYFGEQFPAYCGSCDYCMSALEEKDMTLDAQKLLSAIARTDERYGASYIIDFLRGSASEKINPAHKELKTYGIGKNLKKEEWQWVIQQMLYHKWLSKTEDQYASLRLNENSWRILKGESKLMLVARKETERISEAEEPDYNNELLRMLKGLRLEMADMEHVPAYAIAGDNTLVELATYLPLSFDDLKNISGFGDYKIGKYGAQFLGLIKQFVSENQLESKMHFKKQKPKKATPRKEPSEKPKVSPTMQASLTLFLDGNSIADVAEQRGLSVSTVENHLAIFVASGELEITRLVAKDKLSKLMEVIKASGQTMALKPVKDLLGDEYSYGEVRMGMEYFKRVNG